MFELPTCHTILICSWAWLAPSRHLGACRIRSHENRPKQVKWSPTQGQPSLRALQIFVTEHKDLQGIEPAYKYILRSFTLVFLLCSAHSDGASAVVTLAFDELTIGFKSSRICSKL
ncbi:hypothetical protein F0562_002693 [Nyssa sinensis]|uniref:Uncharacterized protein n=1 Tax=Nyssa sinensis TaxID=561372 RepID=A0A5J5BUU9_9ASTE|nr:hypothetical protein F0562_002693 [Nyssa sinensis]